MDGTAFQRFVTRRFLKAHRGLSYEVEGSGQLRIHVDPRFVDGYEPSPAVPSLDSLSNEGYTLLCEFMREGRSEKIVFYGHQGLAEKVAKALCHDLNIDITDRMSFLLMRSVVLDNLQQCYDDSNPVHRYLFDDLVTKEVCTFLDYESTVDRQTGFWYTPVRVYAPRAWN
jgi:hypothetical protein